MIQILTGDCREILKTLPNESVHCCVTSPPYFGLRDYGVAGQIGLEPTPDEFVAEMVAVFREVRRVLRDDGTLWLNLGDSYAGGTIGRKDTGPDDLARRAAAYGTGTGTGTIAANGKQRNVPMGLKPKDLIGVPWMVVFALRADGWYLRQDIIWAKPNPMPESVTDRCTKAHEYVFLLSKSERYFYDATAIREERTSDEDALTFRGGCYIDGATDNGTMGKRAVVGNKRASFSNESARPPGTAPQTSLGRRRGIPPRHEAYASSDQSGLDQIGRGAGRNKRSVWTVATAPFSEAHFATFPPALIEPCIKAGCPVGGTVLDPFGGAGTTGMVADRLGRNAVLIELNPEYAAMARARIKNDAPLLVEVNHAAQ